MASGEGSGPVATPSSPWADMKRAGQPTQMILGIAGCNTFAGLILLVVSAAIGHSSEFVAKGEASSFTFEVPDSDKYRPGLCIYVDALDLETHALVTCSYLAEDMALGILDDDGNFRDFYRARNRCDESLTPWGLAQDPPLRKIAHFQIPTGDKNGKKVQMPGSYEVKKVGDYWRTVTSAEENYPIYATECMEEMKGEKLNLVFTTISVTLLHVSSILWVVGFYQVNAQKQPQVLPSDGEVVEQSPAKAKDAVGQETV